MNINKYINNKNFSNELPKINELLSSKTEVSITFLGARVIRFSGYEGSITLDELSRKILNTPLKTTSGNENEIKFIDSLKKLYSMTDDMVKKSNLVTRALNNIRDFPVVDKPLRDQIDFLKENIQFPQMDKEIELNECEIKKSYGTRSFRPSGDPLERYKSSLKTIDEVIDTHFKDYGRQPESFQVAIQKINPEDKIPLANFAILDIKMNGKVLELLIKYNSQKNPEVQLLQDEQNGKLYLTGGIIDKPVETTPGCITLAKSNLAKIFIDLSLLEEKAEIDIFEKTPKILAREGNSSAIVVREASEDVLIKIINFKDCRVRMFGNRVY
jgi:hypothetical protein